MRFVLGCVLSLALMISHASADIMLSTTTGLSFQQDSGVQSFQLFAQGGAGDPGIIALISTLTIDSGTPGVGVFTATPLSLATNFNQANLQAASGATVDPIDGRIVNFSLDFTAPQVIPSAGPVSLGTFSFNVNGLAIGNYAILLTDGVTDGPAVNVTNGSFSIVTAVPEPSSLLLLGSVGIGCVFYARRRSSVEVVSETIAA